MSSIMREDWIECDLQEVCFSSKGKKPPILENKLSEKINVPYINIKAFEKGIIDEYTDGNKCNLCEDGDLLMVWDGARAGLSGKAKKGAVGSTLMKIEEVKGIEKQYLSYFLLSLYTKINTNPRGVGIPHVEPRILWYSKLLIVSSPIQRAIVSKIEALFSDLDNGIANFIKAQEQLKIYRQAVLKKAFEGELTAAWREKQTNLPTASALLKQIKEERQNHYNQKMEEWEKAVKVWEEGGKIGSKPTKPQALSFDFDLTKTDQELKEIPQNWSYITLDFATYKLGDGLHGTPKYDENGEYWFINGNNLNNGKILLKPETKKVSFSEFEKYKKDLNSDTILVSINGTIGNVSFYNNENVILGKSACYFNLLTSFDKNYVRWLIDSFSFMQYAVRNATGSTIKNVPLSAMRNFVFPLCSTEEQTQIVQEIESRLSVTDNLEFVIRNSIEKAEALRQSILKKAFEGKLLSKAEIEHCKKEADYEPASELLKKITNEKQQKITNDKLRITNEKQKKKLRNS